MTAVSAFGREVPRRTIPSTSSVGRTALIDAAIAWAWTIRPPISIQFCAPESSGASSKTRGQRWPE